MLRTPCLPGESDMDQLKTIFRALGIRMIFYDMLVTYAFTRATPNCQITCRLNNSKERPFATSSLPLLEIRLIFLAGFSCTNLESARDALNHAYVFALPHPSHPSKLPKPASQTSRPLEELDGSVDTASARSGVKAAAPNKLKRNLTSPDGTDLKPLARRLDFTQHAKNS
ncbi:uncharacterized protein HD556DRAFT_112039 [Suillus plorans]|uniref:Uncharacterized protein n=1 Tax=Suillus plorans TaxID=116603 RepID=A0A9P7DAY5_9AGAM|nr:uncharacterized protein HD556DRAFT_112039 [Suillus plorans]KAG1785492.1 hypothetical protein HD556DRAFT_112039 [Suillus plorans]